jgi:rhodanese-related sulfurtransferase
MFHKVVRRILPFFTILLNSCFYFATDYDQMLKGLYSNSVPQITPDSLAHLLNEENKTLVLDTRAKKEFEVSHIQNATYIGYDDFELKQLESTPFDQPIVVYCSVGYRSERIGEKLLKAGYSEVYNLYGGIFQWVNEGRAVYNINQELTDSIHAYSKSWGKWIKKGVKVYE